MSRSCDGPGENGSSTSGGTDAVERRRRQNRLAQRTYRTYLEQQGAAKRLIDRLGQRTKQRLEVLDHIQLGFDDELARTLGLRDSAATGTDGMHCCSGAQAQLCMAPTRNALRCGSDLGVGGPPKTNFAPPRPPSRSPMNQHAMSSPTSNSAFGIPHDDTIVSVSSVGCPPCTADQPWPNHSPLWPLAFDGGNSMPTGPAVGTTPLHQAASNGHVNICRRLVESGADIDAVAAGGFTPLLVAAEKGHVDCVDFLLNCGCDINARDFASETALHHATCNVHVAVMERLIRAGIDPEAGDAEGMTALHRAAARGNEEAVACLLGIGVSVHARPRLVRD